ncbi:sugar ABC transporter ATP-binding protein [Domibacillus sp. DTU_2020_1001157_1_SI_ALB_TIR_016]|uniref:sugar ABC transporter ATP-binding protein n=1 Tax=Domibacillus sp. DTU_2020_1001157_1_SI_ALB_TIR_016 TaxID=3077789 RepID=UPI0028F10B08|nr:sugar ABC transporter ATP-binding protein [Domibacillus sp. DTU_2020_1001157_1_SI_ALB_TIR_016]WNS79245.1 sugar ABC transporter ATP-binding protein [Domibacillus sp. DTU_2020_1001157_1_SI_ALB_TIR_016]
MIVKEQVKETAKEPVLHMEGISKTFSNVTVLKNVRIELYPGEVHALMGENGAGKSTFMKVLAGIHNPDNNGGQIYMKGQPISWKDPVEARNKGISVIHQELNLSPNLTISENILMGSTFPKNRFGGVKWDEVHERAQEVLDSMGSHLNPRQLVSTLSVAQQQMVEIARALSFKAEVLIMDEPTASLTDKEITKLFEIIEDLKSKGVSIVYISHRMEEIFQISNRFTVLRDGEWITSGPIEETNPEHLVKLMVGRDLKDLFNRKKASNHTFSHATAPVLELKNVSDNALVKDVSFKVYPGEIVGLAGLVGAGRTELVRALFGISDIKSGEVLINGQPVNIKSPVDAIANGIAHVPESRKEQGLFLSMSVKENILMAEMKKHSKAGVVNWKQIDASADKYIKDLNIKIASPNQKVSNLSGGNQQKVVIAKWLSIAPKVLLLDEPTRGVDIGAKTEIHKIVSELADAGLAVLMISSELPEVLGVSDRILVMSEGRLRGELSKEEATQEKIMYLATRGEQKK